MRRFSPLTTSQLARICGVSQGTVDRALHDRGEINPKTKERILAVAKEYGYTPQMKNAENGRSMLIGVVLFDLYNSFFSKLAMSFVEKAKDVGYSVIFRFSNKNAEDERSAVDYFNYIGADGIVIFPVGCDSEEYSEYLLSLNRPILTVGNRLKKLPFVGTDDEAAMYDLTVRMIKECSGDTAYFSPILKAPLNSQNAQLLRLAGYRKAVKEYGKRELVFTDTADIPSDISGLISSTDHYLLRALGRLGSSTDVKLAGFDNTESLKRIGVSALTVEYSTDSIAEECIKYILGRRFTDKIPYFITKNFD